MDYSPDGCWVVAALKAGVQIYEVATGMPVGPLLAETSVVRRVRFSPDGRTAAMCGDQPALQIVEVSSGRLLWAPTDVKRALRFLDFSPDGRRILVFGERGVVRV